MGYFNSMHATRWLMLSLVLFFVIGAGTTQRAEAQSAAWRPVGPTNLGGPIQSLAIDQSGAIWAASPNGGLFKSTNEGQSWQRVEGFNGVDDPSESVVLTPSSIAISGNNIYVGTGNIIFDRILLQDFHSPLRQGPSLDFFSTEPEAYKGMLGGLGNGVYVSTDAGQTFEVAAITQQFSFPNLLYDFSSPWISIQDMMVVGSRVFAATANGVWYSDDNFTTVTPASHSFGGDVITLDDEPVLDLELGANGRIFAATRNAVYYSDDNGTTFTNRLSGLDFPRDEQDIQFPTYSAVVSSRMSVAIAPSNNSTVYVAEINPNGLLWGVWKSTDNGSTWTRIGPRSSAFDKIDGGAGSQSFAPFTPVGFELGIGDYACVLEVDANDPDHIYLAGDKWYEYTPTDGWKRNGTRNVFAFPADPKFVPRGAHSFVQNNDGSAFYLGTDGPIVRSADAGNTFAQRTSGLQAAKMFDVAVGLDGTIYGSNYPNGMVARLGSSSNWTTINRFRRPTLSNLQASIIEPQQLVTSTMNLSNGFGGGLERTFDGLSSYEVFCSSPDPAFGNYLDTLGWASGNADTCSILIDLTEGNTPNIPEEAHHQFSPFKLVEYVDPAGDSLIIDTLNRVLAEQWVFSGNAFGVYATQRAFWTASDEGEPTYTNKISPNFEDEDYGVPTAIDVSEDGAFTVYVGTNTGRLFRIDHANDPTDPDFAFTELTPTGADSEFQPPNNRSISAIAINPFDSSQVIIGLGSYFNPSFVGANLTATSNIHLISDANSDSPSFEGIQGNLAYAPIHALHFNQLFGVNPNWLLAVGTEFGLYTTSDLTTGIPPSWESEAVGSQLSRSTVYGLDAQYYERQIVTYENSERVAFRLRKRDEAFLFVATAGAGVFQGSLGTASREGTEDLIAASEKELVRAYPNPTNAIINISVDLPFNAEVSYTMRSLTGQTLSTRTLGQQTEGERIYQVSTAEYASGLYLLEVALESGDEILRINKKILVQH